MSQYSELVIGHGASYYWRLGESSGTTAIDLVGGVNGTISGGVTLGQAGAINDGNLAMGFNGTTGKVVTAANVTIAQLCTIEAWIKTTSQAQLPVLMLNASIGTMLTVFNGVGRVVSSSTTLGVRPIADGSWHHLAVTLTATTCSIYVDGSLDTAGANTRSAGDTTIGEIGHASIYSLYWQGALDEVAIYPRALSAAEISAHYSIGAVGYDTTVGGRGNNTKLQAFLTGGSTDLSTDVIKNLATRTGEMTARMKALVVAAGGKN